MGTITGEVPKAPAIMVTSQLFSYELSAGSFVKGVYFIKLVTEKEVITKQMVIQ